jgi:hypothetical protein
MAKYLIIKVEDQRHTQPIP